MITGYYYAIFPFCGGGKKKAIKKTKAFHDWATTGMPVITSFYQFFTSAHFFFHNFSFFQ